MDSLVRSAQREDTVKSLLIVDDEIGARESLKMVFKEDYEVLLAKNAEEAFCRVKEHGPGCHSPGHPASRFGWIKGFGTDETGRPRCDRHYDHGHDGPSKRRSKP